MGGHAVATHNVKRSTKRPTVTRAQYTRTLPHLHREINST